MSGVASIMNLPQDVKEAYRCVQDMSEGEVEEKRALRVFGTLSLKAVAVASLVGLVVIQPFATLAILGVACLGHDLLVIAENFKGCVEIWAEEGVFANFANVFLTYCPTGSHLSAHGEALLQNTFLARPIANGLAGLQQKFCSRSSTL